MRGPVARGAWVFVLLATCGAAQKKDGFDDAWEKAWAEAERLQKSEPMVTADKLGKLTPAEQKQVMSLMEKAKGDKLHTVSKDLGKAGFGVWVICRSQEVAKDDKDFKAVARKLWVPDSGAGGVLTMLNAWGQYDPEIRKAIVRYAEGEAELPDDKKVREAVQYRQGKQS
jgi:hypothetical protein